jgi:hypothetical protein
MAKIYAQGYELVLSNSGSLAAKASISGSVVCPGYQRLVGIMRSDASAALGSGSGLLIEQSTDYGASFKIMSASYAMTACGTVLVNQTIYGNAARVTFYNGNVGAASNADAFFALYPI